MASESRPTSLSRRLFLRATFAAAALGGGALLQACGATPSPTSAPKPAAPAPAATAAPAAKPAATTAPAAKPAAAPTTAAAKPTAAPAAAAKPTAAAAAAKPTAATAAAKPTAAPAAAKPAGAASGTIKLVSSLPRQGPSKALTDTLVNAYKMALEDVKNQVGTFTVAFEDWDDATASAGKWTADKESENANKAASDPDIVAYLGTYNSGAAAVAIPILNRSNLAMISPANTYAGLTKPNTGEPDEPQKYYPTGKRNYCRVCPADDLQGAAGATWAKDLGANKVYVLDDAELYGKGLADIFDKSAKAGGLQVLGHESIDAKASDYRTLATKIKGMNPDLVYFGGIEDNNAAKLFQDLRASMPNVKLMGPDGIATQNWIKTAGAAAEGAHITFGGLPLDSYKGKQADWLKQYKDKYKSDPDVYAIYASDAIRAVFAAIQTAGSKDRDAIRAALLGTRNFEGLLGTWSFDENGDTSLKTMAGMIVKDGKFTFSKNIE